MPLFKESIFVPQSIGKDALQFLKAVSITKPFRSVFHTNEIYACTVYKVG